MSKVKPMIGGGQIWFCPGCNEPHHVNTTSVARWYYNGDPDAPTFVPKMPGSRPENWQTRPGRIRHEATAQAKFRWEIAAPAERV